MTHEEIAREFLGQYEGGLCGACVRCGEAILSDDPESELMLCDRCERILSNLSDI